MSCRRQALVRYGNTQHTDQVFVPGVGQAHNKISISISKQSCFLTVTCEINPICNTNEIYQCKKKATLLRSLLLGFDEDGVVGTGSSS